MGGFSSLVGAAQSAEEERVQITLDKDSVSFGSIVICSVEELEEYLAAYPKTSAVEIVNSLDVSTDQFLRMMVILKSFGFEDVSSNHSGNPGWTLYPLPKDRDIFNCNEDGQGGADQDENDS